MTTFDRIMKIRRGEIDLLEHVKGLCDRIEGQDTTIHALVESTYDRERILKEASLLLRRYPDPLSRPPLFGVSFGVKDIFRVSGFPTKCGTDLPDFLFEGPEAGCVSRIKDAGAIVIGKTVTTEFAYFEPGPTRNPHNPEHTPGGSSSGSAAGVASGFFLSALGTQTVGSVIRPAAYCGVVGFKPSFGRVSRAGVIPFSLSADHIGIFCEDLTGIDLCMSVLAEDWRKPQGLKSQRKPVLGIPEGPYLKQAKDDCLAFFENRVRELRDSGFDIKPVEGFDHIETVNENHNRLIASEMSRVHADWYKEYGHLYRPRTAQIIEKGMTISDQELTELKRAQQLFRTEVERKMDARGIDLWICPSATDHAPRGLETTGDPIMNLPWTHAGLPALTIPFGTGPFNLPQGIQVVGHFRNDEALVSQSEEISNVISALSENHAL